MVIFRSRLPLLHTLATLVLALAPYCARGAEAGSDRFESQPLWVALNQFAEQKGFQLLYSMEDVAQAGASRPIGDCRFVDRCLARLLDRKGLRYEYVNLSGGLISIQRALPPMQVELEPPRLEASGAEENRPAAGAVLSPNESFWERARSLGLSPVRVTRVVWSASQLATRKSGLRSLRLARADLLEVLPSQAIVVTRADVFEIESRIYYAPCPAPEKGHFDTREPVCSARRGSNERESVALYFNGGPGYTAVHRFEAPPPERRVAIVAPIPAAAFRIISPAGPRAPPLAV